MDRISYILLVVIFLIYLFFSLHRSHLANRFFLSNTSIHSDLKSANSQRPVFYIIIPVFNEQKIILKTIENLRKLTYTGILKIIVVGSVEEDTIKFLKTKKKYDNRIILLVSSKSGKSNQLNYAINHVLENYSRNISLEYIICYDADSSPSSDSLVIFERYIIQNKFPVALQQPTLYIKNFLNVSWYCKGEALYQISRVLIYEIAGQLNSLKSRVGYTYMVGHGMCLKLDFLKKTQGFSVPFDDVSMGQRLRLFGIKIYTIPTFDISDVAVSLKEIVRQSGGWLLGGLILREYKNIKFKIKDISLQPYANIIILKGFFDTLSWFIPGVLILSCIFLFLKSASLSWLLLIIVWILINAVILYFPYKLIKQNVQLSVKDKLKLLLTSPLFIVLRPMIRLLSIISAVYIIRTGKITRARRSRNG